MTFAAIGYLWAGLAATAAVVLLHFLARRRPKPAMLPTARFVPESAVRSPAFHRKPSDLVLLVLRAGALVSLGVALARPQSLDSRVPVVDLTIGDSAATVSEAFSAALRYSASLRDAADSVALTIEMPLTKDRLDAGALAWRRLWPGSVTAVHAEGRRQGEAQVIWSDLAGGDAMRGIVAGDMVAVGRWGVGPLPDGVVVAWFNDGRPAAVEVANDSGCVRYIAIGLPDDDARLRPAFRRIEDRLRSAPCGAVAADPTPLDSAELAWLEGTGGPVAIADLPSARPRAPASAFLLLLAALCLVAEQVVRRRPA